MGHRALFMILTVALISGMFPAAPSPVAPPAQAAAPAALPAPTPDAPTPSLALSTATGSMGQAVTVSGEGAPGSRSVRVAWLFADATYTAALPLVDAAGRYTAAISVPPEAAVGPAQICVAAAGVEQAGFACADFTIQAPPPAVVDLQLPAELVAAGAALQQDGPTFSLVNLAGQTIASAPIQPDGRVQIAEVPPGVYQPIISGQVVRLSEYRVLELGPAQVAHAVIPLTPAVRRVDPVTGAFCDNNAALVSAIRAQYAATGTFTPPHVGGAAPAAARAGFAAFQSTYYGPNPAYNPQAERPPQPQLGWYVSGVSASNQFQATIQSRFGNAVQRIEVWRRNADAATFTKVADVNRVAGRFIFSMDVGTLPVGASELAFAPVVDGERQCSRRVTLNAALDPMEGLFAGVKTRWNSEGYYEFDGTLPRVPGLPVDLPLDVEFLGDLGTRMNAGIRMRGILELNQVMTIDILDAELLAKIVGQNLLNQRRSLLPPGPGYVSYNANSPRSVAIPVTIDNLASVHQDITFFRGTIISWFGIFNLNGAVGARFGAGLAFRAVVYPLQPRVDATLLAGGFVGGWLEFSADLLGGLVEGGVRGGIDAIINLPLGVDVGSPSPGAAVRAEVGLRTPCFRLYGYMQPYVSAVWGVFKKRFSPITLFDVREPRACASLTPGGLNLQQAPEADSLPRVLPQPALATGADGRRLALTIEDASPAAETPTPQLVARAWDTAAGAWGAPIPLTDGARLVDRPTVAFYGDGTQALAAWAQLGLSEAASADPANAPADQLRTLEIYVAAWDGAAWSAPVQLTANDLPDGRPSIAGGVSGLTLAWVQDADGDAATPDSHIAVSEWAAGAWSAPLLLGAGGRNTQVSVARSERGCPVGCLVHQRRTALVWTNDADGSDATIGDRTLRMATRIPGTDVGWEAVPAPAGVPSGIDAPTVTIGDAANGPPLSQLNVAFARLPLDPTGRPIHISDQATLWAGYTSDLGAGWEGAARELQADGGAIRVQRPLLQAGPAGETLLLFRRFGAGASTATLGQLALIRADFAANDGPTYSAPAYLTGGYQQHWQHALAIDSSGTAVLLGEARPYAQTAADEAELRRLMRDIPTVGRATALAAGGLIWADLPAAHDPALESELQLAQAHASAGATVEVTAEVVNHGRAPLPPGGVVRFYTGTPDDPVLLDQLALPELGFQERAALRFPVVADGSLQPIFAEIDSAGDTDATNNRAFAALGEPLAPTLLSAAPTDLWPDAVEVSFNAAPPDDLAGYRIYRRAADATTVEFVGETAGTRFYDLLLQPGASYCYTARSFDSAGLLSPPSNAICTTAPGGNSLYLPLMRR